MPQWQNCTLYIYLWQRIDMKTHTQGEYLAKIHIFKISKLCFQELGAKITAKEVFSAPVP